MKSAGFVLLSIAAVLPLAGQSEPPEDRRIVTRKGYHIVKRPARSGETPPEVKQEKSDEDRQRVRHDTDINNQTLPTREPELKPREIKP
ncbi:MAG: hypothetical protein M3Z23_10650 [Acidobacteriota bacterium]|nr:hypothetical protein [Acidobacteriota bacterium]